MTSTAVGDGVGFSRFLARMRDNPQLTRDQEADLALHARRGTREAVDRLVESNLGFVVMTAKEYRDRGVPFEDLVGEGCLGLIEAAHRYDADRGCRFVTYAMWWIRKSILAAVVQQSGVVRIPGYHRTQLRRARYVERELREALGRIPQAEEMTARLSMSPEKIRRVLDWELKAVPLDAPHGRNGESALSDLLADPGAADQEETLIRGQNRSIVREAMAELGAQERTVLVHRFGLDDAPPRTLNEIALILGLSRERIRQIETRGKKRLRRLLIRKSRASRIPSSCPDPVPASM